ncbi:MAG: HAMP domain-containing histidine kinase [Prevotellaceae bacterium]|nr:HAMP domain-containing histidine kinase [Prevotellaceae bacterium]
MKRRVIYVIISVPMIAIVANQGYWVVNKYNSYEKEIVLDINNAMEKAVYMEVTERGEHLGGFSAFSLYTEDGDTSRYVKKTIKGDGTTVEVVIDRQDPNANHKIMQYMMNDTVPLNISRLNEIFFREMQSSKFPVKDTYVEHYDLNGNRLISSSHPDSYPGAGLYASSNMMVIDITGSMGVKAYVDNPSITLLRRMIYQSIVLVTIAIACLFALGRTIIIQWKKEKMRQDSVDSMTHEFRRPISAAVSLVSLIPHYLEKNNVAKASQYALLTMTELNKLTAYIIRIQQISNNDKSTLSLDKSEIEVRPFLETLTARYRLPGKMPDAMGYNNEPVKINLHIRPEHPVICAERLHFANVIENLIENAIKYSGEDLVIDLSVDYKGEYLRISVKDNGIGISASDLKRIFDRFYRARHRAVRRRPGYGLGLTYVKSIVESHGGVVEANSRGVGSGSEFIVLMPVDNNIVN